MRCGAASFLEGLRAVGGRAANSDLLKSTFVAEDPKVRKKARLSWYHPDDTVSN
jgi:hypothetical protein